MERTGLYWQDVLDTGREVRPSMASLGSVKQGEGWEYRTFGVNDEEFWKDAAKRSGTEIIRVLPDSTRVIFRGKLNLKDLEAAYSAYEARRKSA